MNVRDVNDNAPEVGQPYQFMVSEHSLIGAVVGTINAWDNDLGENATISYRIRPESLPMNEFFVDPVLGYIQVSYSTSFINLFRSIQNLIVNFKNPIR